MGDVKKPTIMVLGAFHMGSTNDLYNSDIDDLSSPKRQAEIQELVARLKQYQPTKIAVEIVVDADGKLNSEYQQYAAGQLNLKINEVHQIGFRLAAESNHEKLYAIDWMEVEEGKRGIGDAYEWAKENQPEMFESVFGKMEKEYKKIDYKKSIVEIYHEENDPAYIEKSHELHLNVARIGTFHDYVGMDWLTWWYKRNLILFSNLTRLATSEDDRILFLVGASHVHLVSQFLKESDFCELESVDKYLQSNKIITN